MGFYECIEPNCNKVNPTYINTNKKGVRTTNTYRGMKHRGFGSQSLFPYEVFGLSQEGVKVQPHY